MRRVRRAIGRLERDELATLAAIALACGALAVIAFRHVSGGELCVIAIAAVPLVAQVASRSERGGPSCSR